MTDHRPNPGFYARPGRYSRAVIELFEGGRLYTAWHRERYLMWHATRDIMVSHPSCRLVYVLNALVHARHPLTAQEIVTP